MAIILIYGRFFALAVMLFIMMNNWVQATDSIRVGSKIDTEGSLLGNLIVQVLETNGIKATNKSQFGTTSILRNALAVGEIDIYPEYTGNGALFFLDKKDFAWKDAKKGYEKVKTLDYQKNKVIWLEPALANNAWVITVRQNLAAANNLNTFEDLAQWIAAGGKFKLAASAEFIERSDALPAFEQAYGFKLKQDQLLSLAGGDTAVTIKAAAEQNSGVNAAMAYGTDGQITILGLKILQDTKRVQPIYAPAPIIREVILKRYPEIPILLNPLFATLDNPTLQKLNARIAVEGQDVKKVATSYLKEKGFIRN